MRTRRHILLAILTMGFAFNCMGEGVASWLETTHDFGTFEEKVKNVTCQIRFVNTGDSALVITNVRPTCGCTASEYPHDPIAVGDTASITLTYSAIGRPGQFSKDVFVYTNGTPKKTILTIKGSVIGSPKTISEQFPVSVGAIKFNASDVPLGELTKGKTRMAYLSGYNTATDTMVVKFTGAPDYIVPHAVPDTVIPGGLTTATFYYDSSQAPLWGLNIDTIGVSVTPLRPTSTAEAGKARIDVMAYINEDFSHMTEKERLDAPASELSTDKVDFAEIKAGETATRTFTIKNTGKSKLLLHRFIPLDKGITVTSDRNDLKKGKTATVTVAVDTSVFTDKVLNSRIAVITNDPYTPRTYVRVVGLIKH
jgi:hypothetical protein